MKKMLVAPFALILLAPLSLCALLSISQQQASALPCSRRQSTPHKKIIVWDIDRVLLERTNPLKAIWDYPHKGLVIQHMNRPLIRELVALASKRKSGTHTGKELIVNAARRHNNFYLADFFITMINAKRPKQSSLAIVKELHEKGYCQYIGSRMGKSFFEELIKRPDMQFFRDYFDLEHSIFTSTEAIAQKLQKPHKEFFAAFLEKNHIDDPNRVVFIDNSSKNVKVAREVGMVGVLYKNSGRLRKSLKNLEVL